MKDEPIEFDQAQFLRDRHDMLLSLDVAQMRAYARKWGASVPVSDGMCLWSMHMARTVADDMPPGARDLSWEWLSLHKPDGTLRLV